MRKFQIAAVLILIAAALFYFLDNHSSSEAHAIESSQLQPLRFNAGETEKLAQFMATAAKQQDVASNTKIPPECEKQWVDISTRSSQDFLDQLVDGQISVFATCLSYENAFREAAQSFYLNCQKFLTERTIKNRQLCRQDLRLYRASIIGQTTDHNRNYSQYPAWILLNKIVGELWQHHTSTEEFNQMVSAFEEIEPHSATPSLIKASLAWSAGDSKEAKNLLEKGLSLDPQNSQVYSAWLWYQAQNPGFNMETYWKQDSENPIKTYYYASQLWDRGQKDSAIQLLMELNSKDPENEWFQQTLERANSPDIRENPFLPHFHFDDLD